MFQYMLLLRGATQTSGKRRCKMNVSIHAPLARSNRTKFSGKSSSELVSIHAPLARSNLFENTDGEMPKEFQYMLLLRGATTLDGIPCMTKGGFNTCSSCEEQLEFVECFRQITFQYMLLLRGATKRRNFQIPVSPFQYMLLLRGATWLLCSFMPRHAVSIHAPLARSNSDEAFCDIPVIGFNTCSSCEEQLRTIDVAYIRHVSIHAPLARSNYLACVFTTVP